jgi:hypothetical protein
VRADRDRGEIGFRLIVAMALIAALAWAIDGVPRTRGDRPRRHDHGAEDEQTSAATGAARRSRSGRANDAAAQAALNNAIRAAQLYYAETGSYEGYGTQAAAHYDPTLRLTSGPASAGVVSVRGVSPTTVVLVSVTDSGGFVCAAAASEVVTFGRANASSPAQCAGGWAA